MADSIQPPDYGAVLRKYLDADFSLFACGGDAPSESDLTEFEREIGFRLPEEFRKFSVSPFGGIYIEVKKEVWPRAKPYDVGPFWSFLYGMFVYGLGKGIPEWMDLRKQTREFQKQTQTRLVPFLTIVGDASPYCFDELGKIVRWSRESGPSQAAPQSFPEVFAFEVAELKKRKVQKKALPGGATEAGSPENPST